MRSKLSIPASPWVFLLALAVVAAIVYLSRVTELSYYRDEWSYVYDAYVAGPDVFREMFRIDRPARGPFFEAYYSLFGPRALPYHLAFFGWRMLTVAAGFWLFRLLWPGNDRRAFLITVLFAVYPGYLWWVSAIEHQPMIASLALQVISIAATLKAVLADRAAPRVGWLLMAILTGWAYLLLVDYAIGMEAFRFLCVCVALRRRGASSQIRQFTAAPWRTAWATLLVPAGFLIWRLLVFTNERPATDVGAQLGVLFGDPLGTLPHWLITWAQSTLNVGLLAWVVPFDQNFYGLPLREVALCILIAAAVAGIVGAISLLTREPVQGGSTRPLPEGAFAVEALSIGLIGVVLGVLPVVMANRSVTFTLSHYALPASLAGVLVVAGLLTAVIPRILRAAIYLALVALAVSTHYSVLVQTISEERAIEKFWWQVSWRAPGIRPATTLVINYPSASIDDDGYGVDEAANLLYFPDAEPSETGIVHYVLPGLAPTDDTVRQVLVGTLVRERGARSHVRHFDYGNVLILSQPTQNSCVHMIDGARPMLSAGEPGNIVLIAEKSRIENVETAAAPAIPEPLAFGPRPADDWCYYFEAADLAVQRGDWKQAAALGDRAMALGLTPDDHVEWMPILEAYVHLNDIEQVRRLSTLVGIDAFVRVQACRNLISNAAYRSSTTVEMQELVDARICRNAQ